jgi:flagellar biosynthesis GTPase FlhF
MHEQESRKQPPKTRLTIEVGERTYQYSAIATGTSSGEVLVDAVQVKDGQDVVIKRPALGTATPEVRAEQQATLRREERALQALEGQKDLCRWVYSGTATYTAGEVRFEYFAIVTQRATGYTVRDYVGGAVPGEAPLAEWEKLEILIRFAELLATAHDLGMVYNDVQPQHLFWDRSRRPPQLKVIDWGNVQFADQELRPDQKRLSPAEDVQQFGELMYYLFTGQDIGAVPLRAGEDFTVDFRGHALSPELQATITQALHPSIEFRIPDAGQLLIRLNQHRLDYVHRLEERLVEAREVATRDASLPDLVRAKEAVLTVLAEDPWHEGALALKATIEQKQTSKDLESALYLLKLDAKTKNWRGARHSLDQLKVRFPGFADEPVWSAFVKVLSTSQVPSRGVGPAWLAFLEECKPGKALEILLHSQDRNQGDVKELTSVLARRLKIELWQSRLSAIIDSLFDAEGNLYDQLRRAKTKELETRHNSIHAIRVRLEELREALNRPDVDSLDALAKAYEELAREAKLLTDHRQVLEEIASGDPQSLTQRLHRLADNFAAVGGRLAEAAVLVRQAQFGQALTKLHEAQSLDRENPTVELWSGAVKAATQVEPLRRQCPAPGDPAFDDWLRQLKGAVDATAPLLPLSASLQAVATNVERASQAWSKVQTLLETQPTEARRILSDTLPTARAIAPAFETFLRAKMEEARDPYDEAVKAAWRAWLSGETSDTLSAIESARVLARTDTQRANLDDLQMLAEGIELLRKGSVTQGLEKLNPRQPGLDDSVVAFLKHLGSGYQVLSGQHVAANLRQWEREETPAHDAYEHMKKNVRFLPHLAVRRLLALLGFYDEFAHALKELAASKWREARIRFSKLSTWAWTSDGPWPDPWVERFVTLDKEIEVGLDSERQRHWRNAGQAYRNAHTQATTICQQAPVFSSFLEKRIEVLSGKVREIDQRAKDDGWSGTTSTKGVPGRVGEEEQAWQRAQTQEEARQRAQEQEQARQRALAEEQAKQQALAQEQARQRALAEEQAKQQALAQEQARQRAQAEEQARQRDGLGATTAETAQPREAPQGASGRQQDKPVAPPGPTFLERWVKWLPWMPVVLLLVALAYVLPNELGKRRIEAQCADVDSAVTAGEWDRARDILSDLESQDTTAVERACGWRLEDKKDEVEQGIERATVTELCREVEEREERKAWERVLATLDELEGYRPELQSLCEWSTNDKRHLAALQLGKSSYASRSFDKAGEYLAQALLSRQDDVETSILLLCVQKGQAEEEKNTEVVAELLRQLQERFDGAQVKSLCSFAPADELAKIEAEKIRALCDEATSAKVKGDWSGTIAAARALYDGYGNEKASRECGLQVSTLLAEGYLERAKQTYGADQNYGAAQQDLDAARAVQPQEPTIVKQVGILTGCMQVDQAWSVLDWNGVVAALDGMSAQDERDLQALCRWQRVDKLYQALSSRARELYRQQKFSDVIADLDRAARERELSADSALLKKCALAIVAVQDPSRQSEAAALLRELQQDPAQPDLCAIDFTHWLGLLAQEVSLLGEVQARGNRWPLDDDSQSGLVLDGSAWRLTLKSDTTSDPMELDFTELLMKAPEGTPGAGEVVRFEAEVQDWDFPKTGLFAEDPKVWGGFGLFFRTSDGTVCRYGVAQSNPKREQAELYAHCDGPLEPFTRPIGDPKVSHSLGIRFDAGTGQATLFLDGEQLRLPAGDAVTMNLGQGAPHLGLYVQRPGTKARVLSLKVVLQPSGGGTD